MIPRLLVITPPVGVVPPQCVQVAAALGVRIAVLLREPAGDPLRLLEPGARVADLLRAAQAAGFPVFLSCTAGDAARMVGPARGAGLTGLQLRGDPTPAQLQVPRDAWPEAVVGESVHGPAPAQPHPGHGADYQVFAPVHTPGTPAPFPKPAAGLEALAHRAARHPRVFALGGVTPDTAEGCLAAGAYGLAGISTFLGSVDALTDTVAALASVLARACDVSPPRS